MTSPNQKESSPRLYNNTIAAAIFIYVQQTFAYADAPQPAITTEPCIVIPPTDRIQTNTSTTHEHTTHPQDETRAQKIDTALIDTKARTAIALGTPETRTTEGTSLEVPNIILIVIGISLEEPSQVQASPS